MIGFKLLTLAIVMCVLLQAAVAGKGISLAFVIDLTGSMNDDLNQVRQGTKLILNKFLKMADHSPIVDYVLEIFRDPKVDEPIITQNVGIFKDHLAKMEIKSEGNYDCPELAMSGIKKAAEVVRNESTLYVFTDAFPKDHYLYPTVLPILQKKLLKVVFVLTGECLGVKSPNFQVFYKLAKATGGQVFFVAKSDVLEYMETLLDTIGSYEVKLSDDSSDNSGKVNNFDVKPEDQTLVIQVTVNSESGSIKGILYNPKGKAITEADGLKVQFKSRNNIYSVRKDNPEPGKWKLQLVTNTKDFTKKVTVVKNETFVASLAQKKKKPGNSAWSLTNYRVYGFLVMTTVWIILNQNLE